MFSEYDPSKKVGKNPFGRRWMTPIFSAAVVLSTAAFAFGAEKVMRKIQPALNPGRVIVDPVIQDITSRILEEAVKTEKARKGFAIVSDPRSGKILAVAGTGENADWVLGQVLEPASIAKGLVAAEAIEKGVTTPDENHFCENGNYRYGNRVYHDWRSQGWDHLTTAEAVAISSDICAMKIGEKVGAEGLYTMLLHFGFGPDGSAQSFPQARPGTLPPLQDPYWPEMVPAISSGYGFLATPLEILQAYGAIANGGNLLQPKNGDESNDPRVVRRVLSGATASATREILRSVVLRGTARGHASSELFSTAGKTATSYIPDLTQWELVEGKKKGNFAGFIGFAPVKTPQIEVYVGILDPNDGDKSGAHGSAHAAPVFKRIIEAVLLHLNVAPDQS